MKISFDFDNTLSEDYIQVIAKALVDNGHDVWIMTARTSRTRNDLFYNHPDIVKVCNKIGISINKIKITEGSMKWSYYLNGDFDLHFDDDWEEVNMINIKGGKAVLVNPDFIDMFSVLQYKNNKNGSK